MSNNQLLNRKKFNEKVTCISTSPLREYNMEFKKIPNMINLSLGEPDFSTPEHVKLAAIKAIMDNKTHYTNVKGIDPLRDIAVKKYTDIEMTGYNRKNVITTVGVMEGISTALYTLLNNKEEVLVPTPCYTIYPTSIKLAGGIPVFLDTSKTNFKINVFELEKTLKKCSNCKAIILNNPCNPTGICYTKSELCEIVEVCKKFDVWIIADEIYSTICEDGIFVSISNLFPNKTIVLNGVSKSHSMTGWRIGFIIGPAEFINEAVKVHTRLVTTPSSIAQWAALDALKNGNEIANKTKNEYIKRKELVSRMLKEKGVEITNSQGTFYVYAKVPKGLCAGDFVKKLAYYKNVGVIPSSCFQDGYDEYVRISCVQSCDLLEKAVQRILNLIDELTYI